MADVQVWLVSRIVSRMNINFGHELVTEYFVQRVFGNSVTNPKKALRFISREGAELAAKRLGEGWEPVQHTFKGTEPVI